MELQLLQLLFNSSPDGMMLFDLQSNITAWNQKMEHLFGSPAASALGCKLEYSPVGRLLADHKLNLSHRISQGKSDTHSTIHSGSGMSYQLLEITYFPLLQEGSITGGAAIFREINLSPDPARLSSRTYIQFRDVLEKMTDAFVSLDSQWCYTYVNRTAAAVFNRTQEYLIGKHIWSEFPEGIGQPFYHAYYRAVAERIPVTLEEYYPPYDKWFENRIFPLEDGLAIFFSDITQKKKEQQELLASNAALMASQARMQGVLDTLSVYAGIFSKDGVLVYANATTLWAGGVSLDDVLGKPLWETPLWAHSGGERHKLKENIRRASLGETVRFDTSMSGKDQKVIFLEVTFGPLYGEQGEVIQIIGSGVDITNRLESQRELRESHQKYRFLLENFPNGAVFLFDHNLRYQLAGGTELSKVGFSADKLIGRTLREVLPGPVAEKLISPYQRALAGESFVFEDEQESQWYKIHASPVRNEKEEVIAGLVMAQNITTEKLAEEGLKFYQFLVDHINDPVYWISPGDNFRLSYVNQAACRHYGLPAEKLLTLSIPDWDPDFTWEDCYLLKDIMREKKWMVFETRHRHQSGELIPVEVTATLLYYQGKEYYAGHIKDLSERKRNEAALRESEERYRHLFRSNQNPLFLTDLKTRAISDANPAACRVYQFGLEELLKLKATDLSAEPEKTIHSMEAKEAFVPLQHHRRKDGTVFPVELSFSYVTINGRESGIVASRDITRRVEAEQRQKELNQELIRQNGQLQQFSFITSHNLRAPVANISGLLALYDKENPAEPVNREIVENAIQTVKQLDEVIIDLNELLAVTRQQQELEEVFFDPVFEKVLLLTGEQITGSKAQLHADFSAAPAVLSVKSYLQSILYNLVSNAVKYRAPDRPLRVRVETQKTGPFILLTVSDNGLGIDLQKHGEKMFGLYRRFHTHTDGKGLGLHLVKTQVESLGGKVEVESQPGRGSIFKIYLLENPDEQNAHS